MMMRARSVAWAGPVAGISSKIWSSAGQIVPVGTPPYFVLIEKALRDEGASHHYLTPPKYVSLLPEVVARLIAALDQFTPAVERGAA
jgi:hypothetical protein